MKVKLKSFNEKILKKTVFCRYAGPGSQKVQSRWVESFSQTYLVSNREYIVASVDARGSAYQGFSLLCSCTNTI